MYSLEISGGIPLEGTVSLSNSKNSSLSLLAAVFLTKEEIVIKNLPCILDVYNKINLLLSYNVRCNIVTINKTFDINNKLPFTVFQGLNNLDNIFVFDSSDANFWTDSNLASTIRSSLCILGPLLARFGKGKLLFPGGCLIGERPMDLHIDSLTKMGVNFSIDREKNLISANADKLSAADIVFKKSSVGATMNALMVASLAEGVTSLKGCSTEPEVVELCNFLKKMGAQIEGCNSRNLIVTGVKKLHGCEYNVTMDRIEASTFAIAATITFGKIKVLKSNKSILGEPLLNILFTMKVVITDIEHLGEDGFIVDATNASLLPADIVTLPHPGFPTDVQPMMSVLLSVSPGSSTVKETIFENRFMFAKELIKMGADLTVEEDMLHIKGVSNLLAEELYATDLRSSMALVLAGLSASGSSIVHNSEYLDRGYEFIEKKLNNCGAKIKRIKSKKRVEANIN